MRLNINKACTLNQGLGDLDVLIAFLNNALNDHTSLPILMCLIGWKKCKCETPQVNVRHLKHFHQLTKIL